MGGQQLIKRCDFPACRTVKRESEVDHSGVGMLLLEDQLTEVAVICEQDAVLSNGNRENLVVG